MDCLPDQKINAIFYPKRLTFNIEATTETTETTATIERMPFVIYVTPNFTANAVRFINTLASMPDIRVGLISQEALHLLPQEMGSRLNCHWQLEDVFDKNSVVETIRSWKNQFGRPHRILGTVEHLQVPLAEVRELLSVDGMRLKAAMNFRDKSRMKSMFREAGIPCAAHKLISSEQQAWEFGEAHGYPIIVKPPAGAGAQATFKVGGPGDMTKALRELNPNSDHELLLEKYIQGIEHSFDTFSLNGQPVFHSLTQYYPNPLEVLGEPWIQWQVVLPREVEDKKYDDIRYVAFKALEVLGMETGLSHLEWFCRPDGSIVISEVAARPPGAQITSMMSYANDFNAVEAWARMMIFGTFDPPKRKYAVGTAYLRGQGRGKVKAVYGLDQVINEVGHLIVESKIPETGQSPLPSYEGEGYIILRHPETEAVKAALSRVVETVRVELG